MMPRPDRDLHVRRGSGPCTARARTHCAATIVRRVDHRPAGRAGWNSG